MKIPFLDLAGLHEPIRDQIEAAIHEVAQLNAFAGGPLVAKFEAEFAAQCECPFAVGVGSGTDALWLTLLACDIGPGDEVITVPNTFIATAEAITFSGAKPVFVDVDPLTYTMDPVLVEKAITRRTKAIIPVHLFGQMADMEPLLDLARRHRLHLIEDACQAHGAQYQDRFAGSMGDAGCFSFYPGKNLGAWGEAGAVVTHNREIKERIQVLRDHGQIRKYHHTLIGWNARMDGIQAAVLRVKLPYLAEWNERRRAHAQRYREELQGFSEITLPYEAPGRRHVYHLYVLRVRGRDRLLAHLAECGIEAAIHYPTPIHLQEAYKTLGYGAGSFPAAETYATQFLSLPMHPELAPEQIRRITAEIKTYLLLQREPIRSGAVAAPEIAAAGPLSDKNTPNLPNLPRRPSPPADPGSSISL